MAEPHASSRIIDSYFHERNDQWRGIALSLRIEKILEEKQSKFQEILVFKSTDHGNVLVLDGAIQCVEHDEFAYQEMITNLGMMSHPNPRNILVIGGGDGGVLREVFKHDIVEKAQLCDIDEDVTILSKKYLKGMAEGFEDPRATVVHDDGLKFIKKEQDAFDIIITDSSDPDGPAKALFEKPYFQDCFNALKEGGILVTQAETPWNTSMVPLIQGIKKEASQVFPVVEWAWASTPTYPYGCIGFFVMSKTPNYDLKAPARFFDQEVEDKMFKYYNRETHTAAFNVPTFVRKALREAAEPVQQS